MDGSDANQMTPSRNEKPEHEESTGKKTKIRDDLVESKYELDERNGNHESEHQDQEDEQQETESNKDPKQREENYKAIEEEISAHGKRLQEIQGEKRKIKDEDSEEYIALEREVTEIKKRLIDLKFHYKVEYSGGVRQSRRKAAQQAKMYEEEREKRKKELDEKFAEEQKKRESRRKDEKNNEEQEGQQKQEKEQNVDKQEENNAKRQREARIALIEAELAESRLRRSRRSALDAELTYLRATYDYPFWRWRDYYYDSLLLTPLRYPSYLSPYSYRSYLYPYTSSYLYPLDLYRPYPSYLYPYSYPYI